MQTATFTTSAPPVDIEADGLFTALDQRVIDDGAHRWTAFVLGIHSDGRDRWVQVSSGPDTTTTMILRMSRRATADHAAVALARQRAAGDCRPPIIDVMRVR